MPNNFSFGHNLNVSSYEYWLQNVSKIFGFDSSVFFAVTIVLFFAIIFATAVGLVAIVNIILKHSLPNKFTTKNTVETISFPIGNDHNASLLQYRNLESTDPPDYDDCAIAYWWDVEVTKSPPTFESLGEVKILPR